MHRTRRLGAIVAAVAVLAAVMGAIAYAATQVSAGTAKLITACLVGGFPGLNPKADLANVDMLLFVGSNPMVSMVNQAGKQTGLPQFMQPGDIEDFQTLPEPGEGQAHLTKGMTVSKPSGYWTVCPRNSSVQPSSCVAYFSPSVFNSSMISALVRGFCSSAITAPIRPKKSVSPSAISDCAIAS